MLEQAQALAGELVRLRRDFHQHPELSFQEVRTAGVVAHMLEELGLTVKTGVGRTGVVGELGSGDGPTIAIRADMDALPIQEQNDAPYRSQNPGVMHACGHDAHTAIALGAAQLLRQSYAREPWRGKVRFLFQPSEEYFDEQGVSGGTAMIEDGALDGVDAVIALHVWSTLPAGVCSFQDGYSLASADVIEAWVRGTGGHGAYPYKGTDPIYMLAPILTALYAIPSRRINPLSSCVLSLGQVHGGAAANIIPNEVYLQGNIRAFEPEVREQLWAEVEQALKLSEGMGGSYELKIRKGYAALYNDPQVNSWLRATARDLVGQGAAVDQPFGMASEDFAFMTQRAPGAMFLLGAAIDDGRVRGHHTDRFDIDERVLPVGAAVLAETARRFVTDRNDKGA
jgi:amidohydrolase